MNNTNYEPNYSTTGCDYQSYYFQYPQYQSYTPFYLYNGQNDVYSTNNTSNQYYGNVKIKPTYEAAISPSNSAYEAAISPSNSAYEAAISPSNSVYEAAISPSNSAYEAAISPSNSTHEAVNSSPLSTYETVNNLTVSPISMHEEKSAYEITSSNSKRTKRRSRTQYSKNQIDCLEAIFIKQHYPEVHLVDKLSEKLNLSVERISVWFQNRRAKFKKTNRNRAHQTI